MFHLGLCPVIPILGANPRQDVLALPPPYVGESTWDHPCDEYYRKLYEEEKKKKMTKDKAKHDKSKQQVKRLAGSTRHAFPFHFSPEPHK